MKKTSLLLFLMISLQAKSQSDTIIFTDEDLVRITINRLFQGMEKHDSTIVKSVFMQNATMHTPHSGKDGIFKLHSMEVSQFISAVGTAVDESWDERITNVEIQVDGLLAHAWMDYRFYLNDKFLHCGVNSMQLVKSDEGWKIQSIMDTRYISECAEE